ncbi:MAG: hypothetical protein R3E13_06580 [Alphaproteobacteria bacterium]
MSILKLVLEPCNLPFGVVAGDGLSGFDGFFMASFVILRFEGRILRQEEVQSFVQRPFDMIMGEVIAFIFALT